MKPLVVKPPGMLPTPERKSILKAADSTVPLIDSETDSLPSLQNQDDAITISDDSNLEAKMLSFDTEDQE